MVIITGNAAVAGSMRTAGTPSAIFNGDRRLSICFYAAILPVSFAGTVVKQVNPMRPTSGSARRISTCRRSDRTRTRSRCARADNHCHRRHAADKSARASKFGVRRVARGSGTYKLEGFSGVNSARRAQRSEAVQNPINMYMFSGAGRIGPGTNSLERLPLFSVACETRTCVANSCSGLIQQVRHPPRSTSFATLYCDRTYYRPPSEGFSHVNVPQPADDDESTSDSRMRPESRECLRGCRHT